MPTPPRIPRSPFVSGVPAVPDATPDGRASSAVASRSDAGRPEALGPRPGAPATRRPRQDRLGAPPGLPEPPAYEPPPPSYQAAEFPRFASRVGEAWQRGRIATSSDDCRKFLGDALHVTPKPLAMVEHLHGVHAVLSACAGLSASQPEIRANIASAIVPLERAMSAVRSVATLESSREGTQHAVRKALARALDPVARLLPDARASARGVGILEPRDIDRSEAYADKVMQYSGHAPFPTRRQADLLIREAVRQNAPPPARPALRLQLAGGGLATPALEMTAAFDVAYPRDPRAFARRYVPVERLRARAEQAPRVDSGAQPHAARAIDGLVALADRAASLPPPSGEDLAAVVERALGKRLRPAQRDELAIALADAVAPRAPATLVRIAAYHSTAVDQIVATHDAARDAAPDILPPYSPT